MKNKQIRFCESIATNIHNLSKEHAILYNKEDKPFTVVITMDDVRRGTNATRMHDSTMHGCVQVLRENSLDAKFVDGNINVDVIPLFRRTTLCYSDLTYMDEVNKVLKSRQPTSS